MKYIFSLILLCTQVAYGQYSLALNLQLGNTYFLNMSTNLRFNGEMNGQKMTFNSTMNGLARFKVIKDSAQFYVLDGSYDSVHMIMNSPMGRMEFSSGPSSQQNDMASGGLNMMTNKHFNITLLKNGAIRKVSSPDTAGFARMFKRFPAMEQIKKMMMMGQMKHSFNPKTLQENLEKITAIYPNKKVNLNEQWGASIQPDSVMDHSIKTNYQLVQYGSGSATIKGHSVSKANNSMKKDSRTPANYDFDGSSESTFKVDAATGWIQEADIKNDLTGTVRMKDSSMTAGTNKNIPVQLVVVSKLSGR